MSLKDYDILGSLEDALSSLQSEYANQAARGGIIGAIGRTPTNITGVKASVLPMQFGLVLEDTRQIPQPIILLINPNNLDISNTSKVAPIRVRQTNSAVKGYILHVHHDEMTELSMAGKSAMFYNEAGVSIENFQNSMAWNNVQNFLAIYKNNGFNYNKYPGYFGRSHIKSIGHVEIIYDNVIYKGHFNNMTLSQDEVNPFTIDFDLSFKAFSIIDNDSESRDILRKRRKSSYFTDKTNDATDALTERTKTARNRDRMGNVLNRVQP